MGGPGGISIGRRLMGRGEETAGAGEAEHETVMCERAASGHADRIILASVASMRSQKSHVRWYVSTHVHGVSGHVHAG